MARADNVASLRDHADAEVLKGKLRRRGDRILGDELNVLATLELHPELRTLVQYNEFSVTMETAGPSPWQPLGTPGATWADADTLELQRWLLSEGFDIGRGPGRGVIEACLDRHARRRTVHPVRAQLEGLRHDGKARLDQWLATYLGAAGPPSYLRAVGRKFLMQAVARIFTPGCQADHALVLEGRQGIGKSSAVRILAGPPAWYCDSLPELGSKDAAIQLHGKWLIELAELSAVRRSDVESVKAFLSRPTDDYRPPFGRRSVAVARQCVFVATTNRDLYLQDTSGNRRFWPVRCQRIDLEGLRADRNQLLAEAVAAFRTGEPWHLTGTEVSDAQAQQEARVYVSELEQAVAEFLDAKRDGGGTEVIIGDILRSVCSVRPDDLERAGRLGPQVAAILTRAGWHRLKSIGRAEKRRTLYRFGGIE